MTSAPWLTSGLQEVSIGHHGNGLRVPDQSNGPGGKPLVRATIGTSAPFTAETVSGQLMTVRLDLIGGTISPTTSTNLTPDTGHIHLSVDGSLVSMTYGTVQRVVIADLAPGPYVLEAEVVAADHGPFIPRVTASVTFVEEG